MRVQLFALAGLILMMGAPASSQRGGDIRRTPEGRPDSDLIYDVNTITTVEQPAEFVRG